jgi:Uncharacterized protein conserved in bacteria
VTGHRDIAEDKIAYVVQTLRNEIEQAIKEGFNNFVSGFAPGADMIFARLVIEAQESYPDTDIMLEAALPYPNWLKNRKQQDNELLSKCHAVGVHSTKYGPNCFMVRNRYMVRISERVLAVYDGREKGGTVNTMRYATAMERELRQIEI